MVIIAKGLVSWKVAAGCASKFYFLTRAGHFPSVSSITQGAQSSVTTKKALQLARMIWNTCHLGEKTLGICDLFKHLTEDVHDFL